jgi:hypothetical protein
MNISKTTTAVDPNGGGIVRIKLNATGAQPVIDLGYMSDSDFKDITTQKDLDEETGLSFMTSNEKRTVTYDVTLWQSDTNMINGIKEMRDNTYTVAWKKSAKMNQWIVLPNCFPKPDVAFKTGDGKLKLTFSASPMTTEWTLSGTALTAAVSSSGFGISGTTITTATVSANDYYASIQ